MLLDGALSTSLAIEGINRKQRRELRHVVWPASHTSASCLASIFQMHYEVGFSKWRIHFYQDTGMQKAGISRVNGYRLSDY